MRKRTLKKRIKISMLLLLSACFLMLITPTYGQDKIDIVSKYAYVVDLHDGKVVYEKNAEAKMYPASLTKIMTVLVALDNIDNLDTMITMEPEFFKGLKEAEASVAGYREFDEANLMDLLYGIMLPSGADASQAIAYYVAGNETKYVAMMNEKAKALGLTNTHFVNTSGLHDDDHYSTAKDMAVLLKEAMKNETFQKLFSTDVYKTQGMRSHPDGITLYATRVMFLEEANLPDFLSGSKTGFTPQAGLCLASTIEQDGLNFLMITADAGDDVASAQHIKDAYALFNYLENMYLRVKLFAKDDIVGNMPVDRGEEDQIPVKAASDVYVLKSLENQEYTINWDEVNKDAPIETGNNLGKAILQYNGVEVERFDVIANASMEQTSFFKIITFLTSVPGIVSGIVLLLMGIIVYRLTRYYYKKQEETNV